MTDTQKRVLEGLVRDYYSCRHGVRCDSLEGEVLRELPSGFVTRVDWGGLYAARYFPTDIAIKVVKGES